MYSGMYSSTYLLPRRCCLVTDRVVCAWWWWWWCVPEPEPEYSRCSLLYALFERRNLFDSHLFTTRSSHPEWTGFARNGRDLWLAFRYYMSAVTRVQESLQISGIFHSLILHLYWANLSRLRYVSAMKGKTSIVEEIFNLLIICMHVPYVHAYSSPESLVRAHRFRPAGRYVREWCEILSAHQCRILANHNSWLHTLATVGRKKT